MELGKKERRSDNIVASTERERESWFEDSCVFFMLCKNEGFLVRRISPTFALNNNKLDDEL